MLVSSSSLLIHSTSWQGWEFDPVDLAKDRLWANSLDFDLSIFDLSIFKIDRPWSNRSRRSFKKIDRDRITLVVLLNRSTVIESLSSIFIKDRKVRIDPVHMLIRSTVSESIPSIFKKDRRDRFDLFHDWIDLTITKNDDRIPNPAAFPFPQILYRWSESHTNFFICAVTRWWKSTGCKIICYRSWSVISFWYIWI